MTPDIRGIVTCARYAYAPNYFHYCGPEKQRDMTEYVRSGVTDRGLKDILNHFETLYPYLLLIASANHIQDPFDKRVVEAYWLGNSLLNAISKQAFADHLSDTLLLKKKLPKNKYSSMIDHAPDGVPQHTFHVLNVFMRTGHKKVAHTLSTIDQCRIGWGQIVNTESGIMNREVKNRKSGAQYIVKTQPMIYREGKLQLGSPVVKEVTGIGIAPKAGGWVSIHWGYICDVLTERQRNGLETYTRFALTQANRSHVLS
jgi:hypothetical protein